MNVLRKKLGVGSGSSAQSQHQAAGSATPAPAPAIAPTPPLSVPALSPASSSAVAFAHLHQHNYQPPPPPPLSASAPRSTGSSSSSPFHADIRRKSGVAWVPDSLAERCYKCHAAFTLMLRRHHCRRCGNVFCDACSQSRLPLVSAGFHTPRDSHHAAHRDDVDDDEMEDEERKSLERRVGLGAGREFTLRTLPGETVLVCSENVQAWSPREQLDPSTSNASGTHSGTLYVTNFRLIFSPYVSAVKCLEAIPLFSIERLKRKETVETDSGTLDLVTKDFRHKTVGRAGYELTAHYETRHAAGSGDVGTAPPTSTLSPTSRHKPKSDSDDEEDGEADEVEDEDETQSTSTTVTSAVSDRIRQTAMGGEPADDALVLSECKLIFMGIENIHLMRKSYTKLLELCTSPGKADKWLEQLAATRWMEHLTKILDSALEIVRLVARDRSSVLFIDCVWQLTRQFPTAFEFHERFLIVILDQLYADSVCSSDMQTPSGAELDDFLTSMHTELALAQQHVPPNEYEMLKKPYGSAWSAFQAGAVTCVSRFEWHPFSIASAPHDDCLVLRLRLVGRWTKALGNRLEDDVLGDAPVVSLDGPNGTCSAWLLCPAFYEVLLVAVGMGITPFLAVLSMMLQWLHDVVEGCDASVLGSLRFDVFLTSPVAVATSTVGLETLPGLVLHELGRPLSSDAALKTPAHDVEDDADGEDRLAVELGVNLADAFDCLEGMLPLIPTTIPADDSTDSSTVLLDVDHVVLEFLVELLAQSDSADASAAPLLSPGASQEQFLSSFDRLQLINA
ncbi:hypothetical protein P43SY_005971 [Pythium insidiosum]|uniref:phosphatidylinositol-3,5-bisphosphate 3-phosphatase n=1 Tax=Pythium insidiosum TaxID=114742 RepID=A0AAD5Q631_PYTIN|nr:hypothetical protein P43SY_005971 [Pythium insidiosum]